MISKSNEILSFSLRSKCLWCKSSDVTLQSDTLIAAATENADNYLLQELVEDLQLSGELFAV